MADEAHIAAQVEKTFGAWLNSPLLHGCNFAAMFTKGARIGYASFFDDPGEVLVRHLTGHIRVAAAEKRLALGIFPNIVTERQLRDLIETLRCSPGWTVASLDVKGRFAVDIRWSSSDSHHSSVMGFAPLGTMPVTRRAPYVAMALWPCGYDNHRRTRPHTFVGVGDMAHDFADDHYDSMLKKTKERVSETRSVLGDQSLFTGMTFCLADLQGS